MLMFETVKVAVLPALSVAVPVTDWPAPSPKDIGVVPPIGICSGIALCSDCRGGFVNVDVRYAEGRGVARLVGCRAGNGLTRALAERRGAGHAEQAGKRIAAGEAHRHARVVPV